MSDLTLSLEDRVRRYLDRTGMHLVDQLGFGHDGTVYSTNLDTAVKFFGTTEDYRRELQVYQRLKECAVDEVVGHAVPQLLSWDDELLVLEISIVRKPFILDFASAYLDWPPEFSPEILEEWGQRKEREFGRFWPRVQLILALLGDQYGVFLTDIHRGNIAFEGEIDEPESAGSS